MIWTLALILFVLWILGFGVFHVAGGLIHDVTEYCDTSYMKRMLFEQ